MSIDTTPSVPASVVRPARAGGVSLRLVVNPTGDLLEGSRQCEADAFLLRYGNTREQLAEEYARYEPRCFFISLADDSDDVIATTRVTAPGPAGLKTLDDCALPPWGIDASRALEEAGVDVSATWDVTTISVRRGTRRATLASAALYYGLIQTMRANGASATVAILDERVRSLLRTLGLTYRPIPGTFATEYLGSPASVPVFAPFAAMMDEQRRRSPESHRLVSLGIGLDGIALPPLADFRYEPLDRTVDIREPATPAVPALAGSAAGTTYRQA